MNNFRPSWRSRVTLWCYRHSRILWLCAAALTDGLLFAAISGPVLTALLTDYFSVPSTDKDVAAFFACVVVLVFAIILLVFIRDVDQN